MNSYNVGSWFYDDINMYQDIINTKILYNYYQQHPPPEFFFC